MSERRIATVLMLDVVGSTHVAAELGDARYRELSSRFVRIVRGALRRFGGREEDQAGDGFFATFPQPDRAIRCAAAISDEVRTLGIEIRCGVHTGQTESLGSKTQGIAVVIGARVMSLAGPGEILVTSTTKELVTGSGFAFEDLSAHELKGVPGTWQVFAVTGVDGREREEPLSGSEAVERRRAIEPTGDRRQRSPAWIVAGAVLVVAAVWAISTATGGDPVTRPTPSEAVGPPASGVVLVDPEREPPIIDSIPIRVERHGVAAPLPPASAHPLVVGQGGVWTVRFRSLYHVDPSRSEVRKRIPLETTPSFSFNLAEGEDKVWVAFDDGLIEVNPATDEQTRVLSFGPPSTADVATGERFVWVGLGDGRLIRFDPDTGREVTRVTGHPVDGIAFGHGSVWALDVVGETLTRIDPDTMRPSARIQVDGDRVVIGSSEVWVLQRTLGTLTRIDPSTNDPTGTVQVGPSPTVLAAGADAIWVGDEDGVIRRVDEATRHVTPIPLGESIRGLAFDVESDRLWVDVLSAP